MVDVYVDRLSVCLSLQFQYRISLGSSYSLNYRRKGRKLTSTKLSSDTVLGLHSMPVNLPQVSFRNPTRYYFFFFQQNLREVVPCLSSYDQETIDPRLKLNPVCLFTHSFSKYSWSTYLQQVRHDNLVNIVSALVELIVQ